MLATALAVPKNDVVSQNPESESFDKRGGKKKPDRAGRDHDNQRAFRDADVNQDGFLSPEEFAQMKRLARLDSAKRERIFSFLDKNKDGKLHHRELHPVAPPRMGQLAKSFQRLDSDKSGGLNREELAKSPVFKNTPQEHLDRMFRKMDRNKNKELEKSELMKAAHRIRPTIGFEKYDEDKSGGLSFTEYSSMPFMNRVNEDRRKKAFERIDLNKDKQLTPDEIRKARTPMRSRDHKKKPGGGNRDTSRRGFERQS
ncbi:MAG: EF-hand domain-containing protein [Akkermansiaceae bacterium]